MKGWLVLDGYLSVLTTLAWPMVTLAIALIFRHDVTQALGRVGRFKFHHFEVTFQDNLRVAEELARKLPPPQARESTLLEIDPARPQPFVRKLAPPGVHSDERQALVKLAGRSPRQAVEAAWKLVDRSLARAEDDHLHENESRLAGLLQELQERVFQGICQGPTADEARRFVELACPLASRIEGKI